MKNILIYGANGLGSEVLELVRTLNSLSSRWNILGFIDDNKAMHGSYFSGAKIIGGGDALGSISEPFDLIFGIAAPAVKKKLYEKIKDNVKISFPIIIHPSAVVASSAQISEGCVIFSSCFVSVNTVMGKHSLLSAASQLAHDSKLGDFCSVMPSVNISGNVDVEEMVYIGVQSAIRQGLKIGRCSTIGMGSVVVKDVPQECTVMGNPARRAGGV